MPKTFHTVHMGGKNVELRKNEAHLYKWLQQGSNDWRQAFLSTGKRPGGCQKTMLLKPKSWFNKYLSKLHKKGLMIEVAMVPEEEWSWFNPVRPSTGTETVAYVAVHENRTVI